MNKIRISKTRMNKYFGWIRWKFKSTFSDQITKEIVTCTDPICRKGSCFYGKPIPCEFVSEYYKNTNKLWEKFLYKISANIQLFFYKRGISIHNTIGGECCPDFSCCWEEIPDKYKNTLKGIGDAAAKGDTTIYLENLSDDRKN